ncbi:4a-hydroxytetrahydrobiopterin dehydratase [Fodinibius sp. SL11]|uniref:4a-hydroxytetrahydrobiopterin dehydratase n=1 Tax=Fodinibius sp. SL11 TaxID=3425690 RepID=UPI003F882B86
MAEPLSNDQVADELSELPGWSHENDKLTKEFGFDNFRDAITFINRIAFEAEEQVHHPEIFNVYNTVDISLSTHDAGGKVTEKDIKLAKIIESLFNN